ncbi:MAG: hypothetical protein AAGU05_10660, partial [Anaerolineaceae bacterium]
IFLVLISLLVLLCIALISFNTYVSHERRVCYKKLSEQLGVQPTLAEIWESYDERVNSVIEPGMIRDQVLQEINKIAPVYVISSTNFQDEGYYEQVRLKICSNAMNDVYYIFRYTNEDRLKNFSLEYKD